MKGINIWALVLLIIGIIIWAVAVYVPLGEGAGYLVILFAWPLILISLILFIIGLFIKSKNPKNSK